MNTKFRLFAVSITILLSQSIFAKLEDKNYYPQKLIDNIYEYTQSNTLKEKLREVLSSYHIRHNRGHDTIHDNCPTNKECYKQRRDISYSQARKWLFGELHLRADDFGNSYIVDRYCNTKYTSEHGVGFGKIPNPKYISCEHTWPQSRFNPDYSKNLQKNDIHHLYPVNSRANSARGKIIFGEVLSSSSVKNCDSSKRGVIDYQNSQTKAYQPPVHHRGNVARALFYFSVRYNTPISEEEEFYLRRWHKEDPVDEHEAYRNERIFEIQLNRNPFIDQPELVEQIKNF